MLQTRFGLLLTPIRLAAPGLEIAPLPDFESVAARFKSDTNKDGYFYPSSIETVTLPDWPDETRREPVPGTKRPAHLFFLPDSHQLTIVDPLSADPIRDDAAFIVHLLGYLYGTRLQVSGWQFDGRIPVLQSTHHVWVGRRSFERFVPRAYQEWRANSPERRLKLNNILYMHTKAPSYEWPWERFLIEYLVTDAIYDYAIAALIATPVRHEERIRELCGRLGIWCPANAPVAEIVAIRNSLFHQALWEGERPGYKITADTYYKVFELRALNQRLIAALLGGLTTYTTREWTEWRFMVEFA